MYPYMYFKMSSAEVVIWVKYAVYKPLYQKIKKTTESKLCYMSKVQFQRKVKYFSAKTPLPT